MSCTRWLRLGVVAAVLAAGCAEAADRPVRGSFEQGNSFDGFHAGSAPDEGTGEPIELRQKGAIIPGADAGVPPLESDAGFVGRFAPDSPVAHDAAVPPPQEPNEEPAEEPKEEPAEEPKEEPAEEPKDEPTEEPDDGVTISLDLCDLLESLVCAEGLECVDGACTEQLSCTGRDCDLACSQPSRCAAACDGVNKCKVDCREATGCAVSCVGANECEPKCRGGGACEIDCRDATKCDRVACEGDAQCLVRCGEDTKCKLDKCREPRRCSGGILVCNRECPPGTEELEEDD